MDIDTEFLFDGKYENTGSLTNMFLAQSALDESKSLRKMSTGCPYIEAICEELKNRWKTDSITAIFQKFVGTQLVNQLQYFIQDRTLNRGVPDMDAQFHYNKIL